MEISAPVVALGVARSEAMWAELAEAAPSSGPAFIEKLLAKDDGWLLKGGRHHGRNQRRAGPHHE
jgi:hypothetical protein